MFYEEARLKKNILPSVSMRSAAGFSLLGIWKENNTALLLVAVVALVIIFIWLIFRRRNDSFPEIKFNAELPVADKGMTIIESLPDNEPRSTPSPGIYGKIEVIVGNQQISTYLVTDNPLTIGRDPAQALAIVQEAIVSKLHCSIFFRAGRIFIKDLNSTNGTYVNEDKVSERELNDNDTVFLGKKGTVKLIYHK
jgi:hypothetical protein